VLEFLREKHKEFKGETTVLPEGWNFNKIGNTRLKRKRKNTNSITLEDKRLDWLNHTCNVWNKKLNREKKARLMSAFNTKNKEVIEDEIINYDVLKK